MKVTPLVPPGIPSALTTPPTTAASALPSPTPASPSSAVVVGFLPSPRTYSGKFERNYAESLDIAGGRLYLRENFGVSIWHLFPNPAAPFIAGVWDLEATYRKVGDGYNTVTTIAVAQDGSRVLVNWNQDTHGTLLMTPSGRFSGEFTPHRTTGGVALVLEGDRWIGYSLRQSGPTPVSRADVTTFLTGPAAQQINSIPHTSPVAPPGSGLVSDGTQACYCTAGGDLVTLGRGGYVHVQADVGAYAVALGPGGRSAVARVAGAGHEVLVEGRSYPLPNFASALCWAGGAWYAWTGDGHTVELWSAAGRLLTVDPASYPRNDGTGASLFARAVVSRGFVDSSGVTWLYVGTKDATAIVRVTS